MKLLAVVSLGMGVVGGVISLLPGLYFVGLPLAMFAVALGLQATWSARKAGGRVRLPALSVLVAALGIAVGLGAWRVAVRANERIATAIDGIDPKTNREFQETFKKMLEEPAADGGSLSRDR